MPEGGVLIQNPRGSTVNLMINDFALSIGSTALFTAEDTDELTITTLEGNVTVTSDGAAQDVPVGFSLTVTTDEAPELPEPAPEVDVVPSAVLPEPLPQLSEPSVEAIGIFQCSGSGGVDVSVGSTVVLRGGWADYTLESVIDFASGTPTTLDIDGELLPYAYRTGPSPWTGADGDGFQMNWYWEITDIDAGTYNANWSIAGTVLTCVIRAN